MTAAATRRAFLTGAAGAAGAALLPAAPPVAAAGPPTAPDRATRRVVRRGRALATDPRGRRVLIAHDRRRSVAIAAGARGARRLVALPGMPADVAVAPDGRLGAVVTAGWDHLALTLLDLAAGGVVRRIEVGPAPARVAFSPDGRRIVVAGGEQEGELAIVRVADGAVLHRTAVGLVPRGLAVTPDGRHAWVAVQGDDRLVRVALGSGRVTTEHGTAPRPDRIALSPDGSRLLVTHADPRTTHVTELRVADGRARTHAAGALPSAVAWTRDGRRIVALGGQSALVVLGRRPRRLPLPAPARDLAVAGRRVLAVGDLDDTVTAVRA